MSTTSSPGSTFPVRIWQLVWYVCITFVGCIGNGAVIYVILTSREIQRKAPFNIYLFSLGIVDLLICIFSIPIYLLSTNLFQHPTGIPGEWMCRFVTGYFFPFWMLDISAFLLITLVLERRRAVMKPFSILKKHTLKKPMLIVFGIVALAILTQVPTIYGSHFVTSNGTIGHSCTFASNNLLMTILHYNSFVLECIIPSCIFIVCFRQINKQLHKQSCSMKASLVAYKDSHVYEKKLKIVISKRKQTINVLKIVVVVFLVCVVLNEVYKFIIFLEPVLKYSNIQWNSQVHQFTVMLRFSNSFINPLLYGFTSRSFREKLKERLARFNVTIKHTTKTNREKRKIPRIRDIEKRSIQNADII